MVTLPRTLCIPFLIAAIAALAGCAAGLNSAGSVPSAETPVYRVGDRWVYHGEDGFRVKTVWDETHEVMAIGADGITVRITVKGPSIDVTRTEIWSAPGLVKVGAVYDNETRRFAVPLQRYEFPLADGKVWNQRVDNYNEATKATGNLNRFVRVGGWGKVTTPAGTFDAISMQVVMRLDDEEFWRWGTDCNYAVWYAPAVRAMVKTDREAWYREKGDSLDGMQQVRTQHGTIDLVSFTPGRS